MAARHQPGSELSDRSKIDAAAVNFDSALRIMVKIERKLAILCTQEGKRAPIGSHINEGCASAPPIAVNRTYAFWRNHCASARQW
jgi:hypothetical protein